MCKAPKLVPVGFDPDIAVLGVADYMAIFHELTSIFVEGGGEDLLWVLAACERAGIGCVSSNIKTIQHSFLGALVDFYFSSDIVGWGGFFIGFYIERGYSLCFSDILALYVQGGYTWISTRQ